MKKTKLLVCLFAAALIAMSVLCISAFADASDEAEISIESYNVAFSGELHLFYAVNTSLANSPAKIGVKLSYSPETVEDREVFEAKESKTVYTPNPDYPTFYSFGIPAKRLVEVVYATPYAEYDDGAVVYGEEVAYSVLEYCYEMILDDAPAKLLAGEITEKKCMDMQNSLRYLLAYGENVQKYFEWNTDNLPSDYYYFAANNTKINSFEGSLLVHKNDLPESLTLVHTGTAPEGKMFVGWNVTYLDGSEDNIITYTTETNATSKLVSGIVENHTAETTPAIANYTPLYLEFPQNAVNFDEIDPYKGLITNTNSNSESIFKFAQGAHDPENAANRVLEVIFNSSSYGSSSTSAYTSLSRADTFGGEPDVMNSSYGFDGDFYISSIQPNTAEANQVLPSGKMFTFGFHNGHNRQMGLIHFYMENSNLVVTLDGNTDFRLETGVGYDEWFSVKIVLNKFYNAESVSEASMKIIVTDSEGNEYVGTIADSHLNANARDTVRIKEARIIWPGTSINRNIYADNLAYTKVVGEYDTTITETKGNITE